MQQVCKHCQSVYNALTNSSACPHKEHPKLCEKHDRMNCGNPECNSAKIHLIKREEKDARQA